MIINTGISEGAAEAVVRSAAGKVQGEAEARLRIFQAEAESRHKALRAEATSALPASTQDTLAANQRAESFA